MHESELSEQLGIFQEQLAQLCYSNRIRYSSLNDKSEEIVIVTLSIVMGKECHPIYKNRPVSRGKEKTRGNSSQTNQVLRDQP